MINKEIIDYISEQKDIKEKGLIEKDFILQSLLIKLNEYDYIKDNLIFKGGTCIVKCHLDYYRFSEDIDFSWKNQDSFSNKSGKQIRKILSTGFGRRLV